MKLIYSIAFALLCSLNTMAQQKVQGIVKDKFGTPISGIKVSKVGEIRHNSLTDANGVFFLELEDGDYIELNYADKMRKRVKVNKKEMNITLDIATDATVDLGIVKRTEQNITQSVTNIQSELLEKASTSTNDVSNALYGLLSGVYAKQNTGWDAQATLTVRGSGSGEPLILVDGFPRDMKDLTLEAIESVQVLKDGAATALWGARGANGVILIKTKRGAYNSFDIDINYRHGFNFPINRPRMADAHTYALAKNEALRNDGLSDLQYDAEELELFKNGKSPYVYHNTNWIKESMRNVAENNQVNIIIRGGGKRMRYMTILDYQNEFGLLNDDYAHYSDRYNSQIRNYSLGLRTNLDIDVTTSTQFSFNLYGNLAEEKSPNGDINKIFDNFYQVPSAAFPVKGVIGNWGGNSVFRMNPIADYADLGYIQDNTRTLVADARLTQDLSMFLKGLSAEIAIAYDNSAVFRDIGSKTYMYEQSYISDGNLVTKQEGTNSSLAISSSGLDSQYIRTGIEGRLNYEYAANQHQVWASAIYHQEKEEPLGINTAHYRQNVMGMAGYNFDNRYMVDIAANYYGTSVLLKDDKFRFYPAISMGWNISEESFLNGKPNLDLLKLRFSWGKSALDNIDYGLGNHYWGGGGGSYPFGNGLVTSNGMLESVLPVYNLNLETSSKYNVGVDLRMWKNFTASVEYYYDYRFDILKKNNKVSGIFGITPPASNIGEYKTQGVELNVGWNQQIKDFNYYINANWSWNKNEIIEDGQAYQPYDYLYTKGHRIDQIFGLEAIGYFKDETDIAKSPEQTFSQVRPGDIKYKDQNNDKKIDEKDYIAIGKSSTIPDMLLGINLGANYKGFGVDLTFNGIYGLSKMLSVSGVHQPLRNDRTSVSMWYLEDKIRWTEQTKETANMPRLSTLSNENNYQPSTQWLADGSFFKLRNINIHYTVPQKWTKKIGMEKLQIYAKALNVFSIDDIQNFNCEDIKLGYPDEFSLYLGVNIKF